MTELKDKTALITGSTSGIGLGIARALAGAGANILLNGLGNIDDIEKIRQTLEKECAVKVTYDSADMTKPDQIRAMCEKARPIDILINNAGIQHVSPIDEFPDDKWNAFIAINLNSAFHTTKACLPMMKKNGWGRVINIASAHGLVASPFKSAYIAAKHGLIGMTKTVALETATNNITCNAICPGYVNTPLVQNQVKDQAKVHGISEAEVAEKIMMQPQPTKKFVEVDQLGALAVFLCSDAAQNITGTSISVDGGWTAR